MNNKKKLFISLPMRGLTAEEVINKQKMIFKRFKNNDEYELMDNVNHEPPSNESNKTWYLGKSIQMMGDADLIIFANDWADAPGCRIERMICALYGIKYIEEDWNFSISGD